MLRLMTLWSFVFVLLISPAFGRIYMHPSNGETVTIDKANLKVFVFFPNGYDKSTVKLYINNEDVTKFCFFTETEIRVECGDFVKYGKNDASVFYILPDQGKQTLTWFFNIEEKLSDKISVKFNFQKEPFEEGDEIDVLLSAPPGGTASFFIKDSDVKGTMTEYDNGHYRGAYKIKYGDKVKDGKLAVLYRDKAGKESELEALESVNISAYFFKVKILSPENDSKVDLYFDIIGRTRPNAKVFITPAVSIGGVGNLFSSSSSKSSLGSVPGAIETEADEKGFFKVHYGFPIKVPLVNIKHRFYVNAIDSDGTRSLTTSFSVEMK